MEVTLWVVVVVTAWALLVVPLAVACGRAFAAGDETRDLDRRELAG